MNLVLLCAIYIGVLKTNLYRNIVIFLTGDMGRWKINIKKVSNVELPVVVGSQLTFSCVCASEFKTNRFMVDFAGVSPCRWYRVWPNRVRHAYTCVGVKDNLRCLWFITCIYDEYEVFKEVHFFILEGRSWHIVTQALLGVWESDATKPDHATSVW